MDMQREKWKAQWYALYLRSRFEKRVHKDLGGLGIETFLPMIEEIHVWSDRKKKVMEPLFRGYLFVKTDLRDKETILHTDGVVKFVNIRAQPSPIPENQIEWLRRIIGHPANIKRESYFAEGERVRVTSGPLMGVEGLVLRQQSESRVVITLTAIAQSVSVQVPIDLLESIPQ
ncbi:MAG TPA: UpxY family transcription antiterminator [Bacteroidota bacterium]|nr:UpxY family transcription antiterminator [Bacteroidota bacterium]